MTLTGTGYPMHLATAGYLATLMYHVVYIFPNETTTHD